MTPAERQSEWPSEIEVQGRPPIKSVLPDEPSIAAISITMSDEEFNRVKLEVPESEWSEFLGFLSDSTPYKADEDPELLVIARIAIEQTDGTSKEFNVLSWFANPVVFETHPNYASNRSELEVLEYFEQFQVGQPRRKFRGWFERP